MLFSKILQPAVLLAAGTGQASSVVIGATTYAGSGAT